MFALMCVNAIQYILRHAAIRRQLAARDRQQAVFALDERMCPREMGGFFQSGNLFFVGVGGMRAVRLGGHAGVVCPRRLPFCSPGLLCLWGFISRFIALGLSGLLMQRQQRPITRVG